MFEQARKVAVAGALAAVGMAFPSAVHATPPPAPAPAPAFTSVFAPVSPVGDHCVVHVAGQAPTGEMVLTEPRCYPSHAGAMAAEGVTGWGPEAARVPAVGSTFELGRHCDGYNLGTPCTSVVGTGCTGGWLNTSAAWKNRISSTLSGCPSIRHHDLPNLAGPSLLTSGPGPFNLTTFDNRTESLQYL